MFENLPDITNIIIMASIAGFGSSVIGGLIALSVTKPSKQFIGLCFVFAASILMSLVFVDFIPHAIGHGHYHTNIDPVTGNMYQYWYQHSGAGIWFTLVGISIGVLFVVVLNKFDEYGHEHIHGMLPHTDVCSHSGLTSAEKTRLRFSAYPVAFAIILHDLPKGLAIGSSGHIFAALLIGLSCVPEGMTIGLPLKVGGMKSWKILGICGIAGVATVLGAVVGYMIGGINAYLSGMMFAIAAGCVIAIVFSEIMPLAIEYAGKTKWKLIVATFGITLVVSLNYFIHDLMH